MADTGNLPATTREVRQHILDRLRRELTGPSLRDEVLNEPPGQHYFTGILLPSDVAAFEESEELLDDEELVAAAVEPEAVSEAESDNDVEDEELHEEEIVKLNPIRVRKSSSIGLTFKALKSDEVSFTVEYGTYRQQKGDYWQREQHTKTIKADHTPKSQHPLPGGATLEVICRPDGDSVTFTVFLINRNKPSEGYNDEKTIFQPVIEVSSVAGFLDRSDMVSVHYAVHDPDLRSNELLYRNALNYATGHGCAVSWDVNAAGCFNLVSEIIPSYELPATEVLSASSATLEMRQLANATTAEKVREMLDPLLEEYATWIEHEAGRIPTLPVSLQKVARDHLDNCRQILTRMRLGLDFVADQEQARAAFRFMNRVMSKQRISALVARQYRRTGQRSRPGEQPAWRPFQIAFILQCIPGIFDPTFRVDNSSVTEREKVDLLWFPTGGGKTEAYLGLTAFTLALRRLRRDETSNYSGDGGVTVLMRYTLRLLTIQQFQRASTLLCACELERRRAPKLWGYEPFSVGLWVGGDTTPNTMLGQEGSAEWSLAQLTAGQRVQKANPMQLQSCPWCGEKLSASDHLIDRQRKRLLIHCPNRTCQFYDPSRKVATSLPVMTVDDEIYARLPSLLIATVDKLARLPWKKEAAALFGLVRRHCPQCGYVLPSDSAPHHHRNVNGAEHVPRFLPPELIIQDEMHLISGPLGSIVGAYESAIDYLATRETAGAAVGPKYVAATATVRRAADQAGNLFVRSLVQFPPPGLDATDSFFSRVIAPPARDGRLYVGINAQGRSLKSLLVRVYSLMLQSVHELAQLGVRRELLDPYWTLVGYFNSIRELGGAQRLVESDIPGRIDVIADKELQKRDLSNNQQLNSRMDATEVPEIFDALERPMESSGPIDTLLASSMIQVGLDVDRLGAMAVLGQPKSTAEYIQATSRVGRSHPGLVVTLYNWSRPRDQSHYERFIPYHSTLYRFVEATSVTPFSPRARDKVLHAVMIAMLRLSHGFLLDNDAARAFGRNTQIVDSVREALLRRARNIPLYQKTIDEVMRDVDGILDWWDQMKANHVKGLTYSLNPYSPAEDWESKPHLMTPAERTVRGMGRPTLGSMREVETGCDLFYYKPTGSRP